MNKIIYTIVSLTVILVLISGCSSRTGASKNNDTPPVYFEEELFSQNGDSESEQSFQTPSTVTANYYRSLEESRISDAKALLSKASLSGTSDDALKTLSTEMKNSRKNFQILIESIKENAARVTYLYTRTSDEGFEKNYMYLVQENGKWKISLEAPKPNPFNEENKDTSSGTKKPETEITPKK